MGTHKIPVISICNTTTLFSHPLSGSMDKWCRWFYNHEFVAETAKGMGWNLPDGIVIFLYILLMGSFGMIRSISSALGEEIGWQGISYSPTGKK